MYTVTNIISDGYQLMNILFDYQTTVKIYIYLSQTKLFVGESKSKTLLKYDLLQKVIFYSFLDLRIL